MDDPKVSATVNGKEKQILQLKNDSYDGVKLKAYNSGSDRVVLKVTSWQIQQLLNLFRYCRIGFQSRWKDLGQVDFTVDGLMQPESFTPTLAILEKTHRLNVPLQVTHVDNLTM